MKPTLLYYLFDGKRFESGKRFGMYKFTATKWRIMYDLPTHIKEHKL